MDYKVIKFFTDLQDNDFAYNVGETFPREGKEVTPSRLAELSSTDNKRGVPLIELVKDKKVKETAPKKAEEVEEVVEAAEVAEQATEPTPAKKGGRPKKKSE